MSDLSGDAFVEMAEKIATKADFVDFAQALFGNYKQHPEEWENKSLESFLQGLAGFVQNSEGYYHGIGLKVGIDQPSWRVLADVLIAARVYE